MARRTSVPVRRVLLAVGVVAGLSVAGVPAAAGGTTHVVTTTADSGPGSLRDTIAAAASGDTITFAPTAHGQIVLTTGVISVDKALTIRGPDPAAAGSAGDAGTCWDTTTRPLDPSAEPNPTHVVICGTSLSIGADGVSISNLSFEDSGYLSVTGSGVTITDNWFDVGRVRTAVDASWADGTVVTGNRIHKASRGVQVGSNAVIRDNRIFTDPARATVGNSPISGVEAYGPGNRVLDNVIRTPSGSTGVVVSGSTAHADIHGNTIGLPQVPADGAIRAGDGIAVRFEGTANVGPVPDGAVGARTPQCPSDLSAAGLTAPNRITNVRQAVVVGLFSGSDYTDDAVATVCGNVIGDDVPGSAHRVNSGVSAQYGGAVVAGGNVIAYVEGSAIRGLYARSLTATDNYVFTNASRDDLRHDSSGSGLGVSATGAMPPYNNPPAGGTLPAQLLVDVRRNHVLAKGVGISAGAVDMSGTVEGNVIGVATGGTPPMIRTGISVGGGGSTFTVTDNTVVNAEQDAIYIGGPVTATVTGNRLGVDPDGTPGPNGAGISIDSTQEDGFNVSIGGVPAAANAVRNGVVDPFLPPGAPNVIVNSSRWGIGGFTQATPVVRGNHIGGLADGTAMPNGRLGIEWFGPEGFTPQSPPTDVVRSEVDATTMQVTGTVTDDPGSRVVVEVYGNPACHAWGAGEGVTPLTVVDLVTDGGGTASFDVTVPSHPEVSATATGTRGTSMFSACTTPPAAGDGGAGGGADGGTGGGAGGGGTGAGAGDGGTGAGAGDGGTGAGAGGAGGAAGGTGTGTETGTGTDSGTTGTAEEDGGGQPTVQRTADGGGPVDGAAAISQQRFPEDGLAQSRTPDWVVLARADVFADAMVGSSLTGNAPLLFTEQDVIPATTQAEIDRLLPSGGTVVLLGGEEAIQPTIHDALVRDGHEVIRLAGATRVETAIAVADFLDDRAQPRQAIDDDEVFLARAHAPADEPEPWADAISAGALAARTVRPILLTPTDALPPSLATWLQDRDGRVTVLGGPSAISDDVVDQLGPARRIAGQDRAGTAARIATELWADAASGGFQLAASNRDTAWMLALAGAGLAADESTPLLLTEVDRLPEVTATLLACADGQPPAVRVLGGEDMVSPSVIDQISACET